MRSTFSTRPPFPMGPTLVGALVSLLLGCAGPEAGSPGRTGGAGGPGGPPAELALHRGLNALDEGRADQARIELATALEAEPGRPEVWRLAGDAWMTGTLRSPSQAIEAWGRYLEGRPGDPGKDLGDDFGVATRLAESLLLLGEWQQAETWCERLGDDPRAQRLRARVFLDIDPERAEAAIRAALAGLADNAPDTERAETHALAARVYSELGEDERALDHAEQAVGLDPLDLQSTYLLARVARRRGDPERTDALLATHQLLAQLTGAGSHPAPSPTEGLRLVRELVPRVAAGAVLFRLEWLRRLVANGQRDEALELLEGLAEEQTLPTATRLELVGLADRLGDLDQARRWLEQVLAENEPMADAPLGDPRLANHREALYGLALLDHREGDFAAARTRSDEGLEHHPQSARFHHLAGRLELISAGAEAGTGAGGSERAAQSFSRALELAPWNTEYRLDLANLWLAEGRIDAVQELLAAAPEDDPALDVYRRRHGLL